MLRLKYELAINMMRAFTQVACLTISLGNINRRPFFRMT